MTDTPPLVPQGSAVFLSAPALRPELTPAYSSELDARHYLSLVRRHFWLVLGSAVVALAGTALLLSREIPLYRATALIRIMDSRETLAGSVLSDGSQVNAGGKADPVLSELVVLGGRGVAGAVVNRLGLRLFDMERFRPATIPADVAIALAPESTQTVRLAFGPSYVTVSARDRRLEVPYATAVVLDSLRFTVPSRPSLERVDLAVVPSEAAIDYVLAGFNARQREGTNAIDVRFTSDDPSLSARVVNAIVEEFRSVNAAAARENAVRRRVFLEQQLRDAEVSLVAAQTALEQFRGRKQLYSSGGRSAAERAGLSQLDTRRSDLDTQRRTYLTILTQLQQADVPGLVDRELTPEFARALGRGFGSQGDSRAAIGTALQALMSYPGMATNPVVARHYAVLQAYETRRDSLLVAGRAAVDEDVQQLGRLMQSTQDRLVNALRGQVSSLEAQVGALDELRNQSASRILQLSPAESEEVQLTRRMEAARRVWEDLRQEYQKAQMAEVVETGQVAIVDLAPRAESLANNRGLKLVLGLVFGLLLGAAAAFLMESLNTTIRRRSDIERELRLPGLAVIPRIRTRSRRILGILPRWRTKAAGGRANGKLDNGNGRGHPFGNGGAIRMEIATVAFRTLRTRLIFSSALSEVRTLAVTSPVGGEGKTTTAANLALSLAQQGTRILLVDGDLSGVCIPAMFQVPAEPGLAELLSDTVSVEEVIRPTAVEGLYVLPRGATLAGSAELLGRSRLDRVLQVVSGRVDLVVIDTPPILTVPDASVIAARADRVLLVLRAGRSDRSLAHAALQHLDAIGAQVIGAVLNDPDAKAASHGEDAWVYAHAR